MKSFLAHFNPFSEKKQKTINTPWGKIEPTVDIFPILYLMVIYGLIYILPFGKSIIGISWFDWFRSEDGPLEWIQFICYTFSFICCSIVLWRKRNRAFTKSWFVWFLLALLCFFVAGEEISWGERLSGYGIEAIRAINKQGETTIHNIRFFHLYLLDPSFEISCLLFGWLGWNLWPEIDAFPKKKYTLYFLFVALFFFYFDISYSSTIKQIRNDQEIFELLMSLGLFLHSYNNAFKNNDKVITSNKV